MMRAVQENYTEQYCTTLDDTSDKTLSNATFVQYSPTESSDWWSDMKPEVDDSPKDSWPSDSDSSQQTLIYGRGRDANTKNIPVSGSTFNLNSTFEDGVICKEKENCQDTLTVNKPAQVVERRNARERRRVQAVNGAFQKLRKVVPIEETKSKRMSKVKTLQLAIAYINQLQSQLQFTTQHSNDADLLVDLFSDYQQQAQVKLEHNDFPSELSANIVYSVSAT